MATKNPNRGKAHEHNPAQDDFEGIIDRNLSPEEKERLNSIADSDTDPQGDDSDTSKVKQQEEQPAQPEKPHGEESGFWRRGEEGGGGNEASSENQGGKQTLRQRFENNKKPASIVAGGGGIAFLIFAGFFALMPLKLQAIIGNITAGVAAIPEHAIERRLQVLTTHYLANKVVNGGVNRNQIFVCRTGGIACSLFNTWRTTRFETKIGVKEIQPLNRATPGGPATSWRITFDNNRVLSGTIPGGTGRPVPFLYSAVVDDLHKQINGSREMRQYIRQSVKQNTHWYQVYKRYAMRKLLMKKFGVRGWRGPPPIEKGLDSWRAKYNSARITIKTRLIDSTIGRIAPRLALYFSCYGGGASCADMLRHRDFGVAGRTTVARQDSDGRCDGSGQTCDTDNDRRRHNQRMNQDMNAMNAEARAAAAGAAEGVGSQTDADLKNSNSRLLSKRLLSLTGIVSAVFILDMVANIFAAIDDGAVNIVAYDMGELAYAGFAAEFLTADDKRKEGDLDLAQLAVLSDTLGSVENSPHFQREAGIYSGSLGLLPFSTAAYAQEPRAGPVYRDCDGDGNYERLPDGETICDNKKIGRCVTCWLTNRGWFQGLADFSHAYKETPLAWFLERIGDAMAAILSFLGLDKILEWIVEQFVSYIFDVPVEGTETDGDAYDAVSGGIHASYNSVMQYGRDNQDDNMETSALGGGGKRLTDEQLAALDRAVTEDKATEFASKPLVDKLFNPYLEGSFAQAAVIRLPTNIVKFSLNPIQNILALASPAVQAQSGVTNNAFGLVKYGYTVDDPIFEADPAIYTEDKCSELAQLREDSYGFNVVDGEALGRVSEETPVPFYNTTDPCALESLVASIGSAAFVGGTDPAYDLSSGISQQDQLFDDSDGEDGVPSEGGWSWPIGSQYRITNCFRRPGHTGIDMAAPRGTSVLAARAGQVVIVGGPGGDSGNYIILKHPGAGPNGATRWTNYQHLDSRSVRVNEQVTAGQEIGKSGNTGFSTGPHLHFSVTSAQTLSSRTHGRNTLDPLIYLPFDENRSYGSCRHPQQVIPE